MSQLSPPNLPSYTKPWLAYAEQIQQLEQRGLKIDDRSTAEEFLAHVNYYRLSGYCLAFEQQRHQFIPGVTFGDVRGAYEFDVTLRDLVTEALEVIEIDVRTCIAHHFGERHGAFGHTDPTNFYGKFDHSDLMSRFHEESERSSELFIKHFRATYVEYPDLPVWMLTEVISFGTLTRMFRGMDHKDQRAISSRYHLQGEIFGKVLLHFVYVRNLCAHHARLWDRVWSVKPTLPHGAQWQKPHLLGNERLFSTVCLLLRILKRCPAASMFAAHWQQRIRQHLNDIPTAPTALELMGMPPNWDQHPAWQ